MKVATIAPNAECCRRVGIKVENVSTETKQRDVKKARITSTAPPFGNTVLCAALLFVYQLFK